MRKLYRSSDDRVLVGICGGFAEYFNVDATLIRIVWLLFSFFGGYGILAYILALVFIPERPGTHFSYHPSDVIPGKESPWSYVFLALIIIFILRGIPLFQGLIQMLFSGIFRLIPVLVVLGILYLLASRREEAVPFQNLRWHISQTDRFILGVCGGIGETFKIEPVIVRLAWALGTLFVGPLGVILYILAYFLLSKTK